MYTGAGRRECCLWVVSESRAVNHETSLSVYEGGEAGKGVATEGMKEGRQ